MPDKEPIYKTSPKDIGKRIKSIKIANGWTLKTMEAALSDNKLGIKVSIPTIRGAMDGINPPTNSFLNALILKGYDPYWILTGLGDKKLDESRNFKMTDIHLFRVELLNEATRRRVLEERLTHNDNEIAYLKRTVEELQRERQL